MKNLLRRIFALPLVVAFALTISAILPAADVTYHVGAPIWFQLVTDTSATTVSVPPWAQTVDVYCQGSGGGGEGGLGRASGAGGGTLIQDGLPVAGLSTISIVIGVGGTAGADNSGAGGTSSNTTYTINGVTLGCGAGGGASSGGTGGTGGTPSGNISAGGGGPGTSGGNGGVGIGPTASSYPFNKFIGWGGSGGTAGNNCNSNVGNGGEGPGILTPAGQHGSTQNQDGAGAGSSLMGQGGNGGHDSGGVGGPGLPGTWYGAGGGGGSCGSGTNRHGGAGYQGGLGFRWRG